MSGLLVEGARLDKIQATKVKANRSRSKVPFMHTHWRLDARKHAEVTQNVGCPYQKSYATSSALLEVTRVPAP